MPDSCFPGPADATPSPHLPQVRGWADGAAHTFPSLPLQWEDTETAAGAWEEGKDEEPAL